MKPYTTDELMANIAERAIRKQYLSLLSTVTEVGERMARHLAVMGISKESLEWAQDLATSQRAAVTALSAYLSVLEREPVSFLTELQILSDGKN